MRSPASDGPDGDRPPVCSAGEVTAERTESGFKISVAGGTALLSDDEAGQLGRFLGTGPAKRAGRGPRRGTGAAAVAALIESGFLAAGQELSMKTGGRVHRARLLDDGSFDIDGHVERSPSEAAAHAAQSPRSGWRMWRTASGESLEDVRWRWRARQFQDTVGGDAVVRWADWTLSRHLNPGRDNPNAIAAFTEETPGIDPQETVAVLAEWFAWCRQRKVFRGQSPK